MSMRYSASGMKKLCACNMCAKLESREADSILQNRHCDGLKVSSLLAG